MCRTNRWVGMAQEGRTGELDDPVNFAKHRGAGPTQAVEDRGFITALPATANMTDSQAQRWTNGSASAACRWGQYQTSRNRPTTELLYDILTAIHLIWRGEERLVLSNIGHRANVPNGRLKARLAQLGAMGLIDTRLELTKRGYEYCADYKKQVEPFLRKYGLRGKDGSPGPAEY